MATTSINFYKAYRLVLPKELGKEKGKNFRLFLFESVARNHHGATTRFEPPQFNTDLHQNPLNFVGSDFGATASTEWRAERCCNTLASEWSVQKV